MSAEYFSKIDASDETECWQGWWGECQRGTKAMDGNTWTRVTFYDMGRLVMDVHEQFDRKRAMNPLHDVIWPALKKGMEMQVLNSWRDDDKKHG